LGAVFFVVSVFAEEGFGATAFVEFVFTRGVFACSGLVAEALGGVVFVEVDFATGLEATVAGFLGADFVAVAFKLGFEAALVVIDFF
jgi:hypothetical protein